MHDVSFGRYRRYFETFFLGEVDDFFQTMDVSIVKKILYVIDLAEQTKDAKLFK